MGNLTDEVRSRLVALRTRRLLILGMGNTLRGDDAFGPELVRLVSSSSRSIACIDAGTTPENQVGAAVRHAAEVILVADAVHLGREPGTCALLSKVDLARYPGLGTHDISPSFFLDHLEEAAGAEVLVLAVQPADLSFGEPLSAAVVSVLGEIVDLLTG